MREEHGDTFIFKGNMPIRLTKPSELSHECVLKNSKYQWPYFYSRLFDESEKRPFKVSPDRTKKDEIKKSVPGATEL